MLKKILLAGLAFGALFGNGYCEDAVVPAVCTLTEYGESKTDDIVCIKTDGYNSNMEDYIVGVVAGEMPADFHMEALKAQAVAARTYALRQKNNGGRIWQEYLSIEQMRERWGDSFNLNYKKICDAVFSTEGIIIVYDNQPALAVFCSASGGMTEASKNVWGGDLPYLKSVISDGDITEQQFIEKISVDKERFGDIFGINPEDTQKVFSIKKRTDAGYVEAVEIAGRKYTGMEIRNILGLRSAYFDVAFDKNNVVFSTRGFGHGVGMSQYGAEYMAKTGSTYFDILKHYYSGVEIMRATECDT